MAVETRHVRYVFADVVRFTEDRTLEAQVEIVAALNAAFTAAIGDLETIYLPTGDGICAGILDVNVPADIHLQTALRILEHFHAWSSKAAFNRMAEIRVAINESVDAIIIDVNGNRNLAGAGINLAQRLMSIADGNQIIVGPLAYETLHVRDQYVDAFRELKAEIKHGHVVKAYQFKSLNAPFLNIQTPWSVRRADPIDLEMHEDMEEPGGYSTSGMARALYAASDRWKEEMRETIQRLDARCNQEQRTALHASQEAWEKFYESEGGFLAAVRQTVMGTMYRFLSAAIDKNLVRGRTRALRNYLEEWVGDSSSDESLPELPSPDPSAGVTQPEPPQSV